MEVPKSTSQRLVTNSSFFRKIKTGKTLEKRSLYGSWPSRKVSENMFFFNTPNKMITQQIINERSFLTLSPFYAQNLAGSPSTPCDARNDLSQVLTNLRKPRKKKRKKADGRWYRVHLDDHPRTRKWLGSPPFISHETTIWKGNNPILRGLTNHGY